jgi:uncharacterized membrane protein
MLASNSLIGVRASVLVAATLWCLLLAGADRASGQVGVEAQADLEGLTFTRIGVLPGYSRTRVTAVSADGTAVVGYSGDGTFWETAAFRWTRVLGRPLRLGGFPQFPDANSVANDVSANGSLVVGEATAYVRRPVRWPIPGWIWGLPYPAGPPGAVATAVSANGDVVAGISLALEASDGFRALIWTPDGEYVEVGETICCGTSIGLSADGDVMVFQGLEGPSVHRAGEGTSLLPLSDGFENSRVEGISSKGNLMVGTGGLPRRDPVVWTPGSIVSLEDQMPVGMEGVARAISRNGTMIVGSMSIEYDTLKDAFLWTAGDGVMDLREYLVAHGIGVVPWNASIATDVSDDGRTIVGYSVSLSPRRFEGWVVQLPPACGDGLDNDGDGLRDGHDSDCDGQNDGDAESQSVDPDGDGIPHAFDNCRNAYNPEQVDTDDDTIGDACDPFPEDPDHEFAQCRVDLRDLQIDFDACRDDLVAALSDLGVTQAALGECSDELATCEDDLAAALADSDGDGLLDLVDQCAGTAAAVPVDPLGCSLEQFCSGLDVPAICNNADWQNDEPLGNAHDCKAAGGSCAPR